MGKIKSRKKNMVFRLCIYAEVIAGTIIGGWLCGTGFIDILRNIAVSITGIMVFVYYYSMRGSRMVKSILSQKVFLASFAVSNLLVAFTGIADTGTIWMAAVAVVAAREGMGHAVSCHLLLMLQYSVISADAATNTKLIIFYALLGILLALVVSEIKKQRLFIYAAVVFISLTLVIAIVINGSFKETWDNRGFMLKCVAGDIILLAASWVTYRIKRKNTRSQNEYKNSSMEDKAILELASTDHELMQKIKNYSTSLYAHSLRTGNLSGMAAEFAGYGKNLAKAGGYYHEAGRIYGNEDYKEACSQIIKEFAFPIQLADIIKQHGEAAEKPGSPEAAVVMLSDSIISMDEYFDRTGKREQIPDEKLVKSVFNSRMAKGSLDNSGIDKENIEKLMDFYIKNAFKEETREEHYL
ncbi:MAG: hypothetical protein K2K35_11050 [Lachnospiraceae bacterium]|nr:hypothetical protein [Lachnospiraceae bacterium]